MMVSFALLLACVFASAQAIAQNTETGIRLSTNEQSVFIGDSIVIDVETVGLLEPVDTRVLSVDADLIRETAGTRIAVVDGRVVDVRTRRMEFLPRSEGVAHFGPLVGNAATGEVRSNRLSVSVLPPADVEWVPDDNDVSINVRVSTDAPWVRQEVTLDIELRHRYAVADETIELPDFDGFDVLPVFESRRTIDDDADPSETPLRLVAWRYLLWPQRSGALQLEALSWTGTLVRSRTSRAEIDLSSRPVNLQVRPAATDNTDWWLPARAMKLNDDWSADPRELTAGESIERTLILEAEGVLASQLPNVEPLASRSMSSVSLGNTRQQQLIGDRVVATAEYRFRLTARSPVPVFLDTVRVPWWDTTQDQEAEVIVPARRVNIGLPDRADLLADIALEQSLWARLQILAASVKLPTGIGILLICLLLLAALGAALLPWPLKLDRNQRKDKSGSALPPM